jgi:hypothetical protein
MDWDRRGIETPDGSPTPQPRSAVLSSFRRRPMAANSPAAALSPNESRSLVRGLACERACARRSQANRPYATSWPRPSGPFSPGL